MILFSLGTRHVSMFNLVQAKFAKAQTSHSHLRSKSDHLAGVPAKQEPISVGLIADDLPLLGTTEPSKQVPAASPGAAWVQLLRRADLQWAANPRRHRFCNSDPRPSRPHPSSKHRLGAPPTTARPCSSIQEVDIEPVSAVVAIVSRFLESSYLVAPDLSSP